MLNSPADETDLTVLASVTALQNQLHDSGERFVAMYEVLLHPDAQVVYINADQSLAKKLARCLQQLEQTPRFYPNIKALKGDYKGYYRYRVGDYRVIYSVDEDLLQVLVVAIAHRREAYEP